MDLPADVRETLEQVFAEASDSLDDPALAGQLVETARRVAKTKVPEGPLRERLLFGCDAVETALSEGDDALARGYLESMERRVAEH